jgi:hypothetical protein
MPKFNPLKDIPSLSGKVAIVTGGKYVFVSTVHLISSDSIQAAEWASTSLSSWPTMARRSI